MKGKQKGECTVKKGFNGGLFLGMLAGIVGSFLSLLWFILGILLGDAMREKVMTEKVKQNEKAD